MAQQNEEASQQTQEQMNFQINENYDAELEMQEIEELQNLFQTHFQEQLISMTITIQSMEETKLTPKQQKKSLLRKLKLRKFRKNVKAQAKRAEKSCDCQLSVEQQAEEDFKKNQACPQACTCISGQGEWQQDRDDQGEHPIIPHGMLNTQQMVEEINIEIVSKLFLNELSLPSLSSLRSLAL